LADGGGGRGKCPHVKMSSCKKGEGIVRDGEISGGNMSGEYIEGEMYYTLPVVLPMYSTVSLRQL